MVKQIAILQANKTGNEPEIFIHDRLKREGYCFVPNKRFSAARILIKQPIHTRQFEVGKNIYDTKWQYDFILYHKEFMIL
ncbi:hypothetical protein A3305_07110 [Rickettsia amblyommatis]|uniref:Uncharacterized protein n=1 Tax=Rickettsia amblyommatis (strain GAT-30V) TaxID=1105111 RepID=H8K606_RICAG|nr:hypothetical protein [Rickettsia amblyommatis]AFC69950.1 hypothetical protein MCE_05490 [Rickettsia amblyommatis str. GAT-30V]ARD88075.1 hypothetical protein A3305_07110 [Rickettsia amblyommatis]KJV91215.1 hypothetical protein RAMDARK_1128 [Rickettsia amblyommatis str. Darkwater]